MPHSDGFVHPLAHDFDRALEVEALVRTHIQLQGGGISIRQAQEKLRKRGGHGLCLPMVAHVKRQQTLGESAVDILVTTALPGAVRVAEVDRHARTFVRISAC
jgi:hypothetical protein